MHDYAPTFYIIAESDNKMLETATTPAYRKNTNTGRQKYKCSYISLTVVWARIVYFMLLEKRKVRNDIQCTHICNSCLSVSLISTCRPRSTLYAKKWKADNRKVSHLDNYCIGTVSVYIYRCISTDVIWYALTQTFFIHFSKMKWSFVTKRFRRRIFNIFNYHP